MTPPPKRTQGHRRHRERCASSSTRASRLATLLNTQIGLQPRPPEVAKESEKSGRPVRDIVAERGPDGRSGNSDAPGARRCPTVWVAAAVPAD